MVRKLYRSFLSLVFGIFDVIFLIERANITNNLGTIAIIEKEKMSLEERWGLRGWRDFLLSFALYFSDI